MQGAPRQGFGAHSPARESRTSHPSHANLERDSSPTVLEAVPPQLGNYTDVFLSGPTSTTFPAVYAPVRRRSCGSVRGPNGHDRVAVPVTRRHPNGALLCRGPMAGPPGGVDRVPPMDKVVASAAEAVADIPDGATLAVGGFGLCGIPSVLIAGAARARASRDLEVVSNNCGVDDWGLGILLAAERIRRMIVLATSGRTRSSRGSTSQGELEVELTPQGTLAERLRAGGAGIPAFFTPTGVGTQVADGGLPWQVRRRRATSRIASPAKEVRVFERRRREREYVLEEAIVADFGLVRAWKGDRHGNLVFNKSRPQLQPARRDGRPGHASPRSRSSSSPASSTPTTSTCPASTCSGSCRSRPSRPPRSASSGAPSPPPPPAPPTPRRRSPEPCR